MITWSSAKALSLVKNGKQLLRVARSKPQTRDDARQRARQFEREGAISVATFEVYLAALSEAVNHIDRVKAAAKEAADAGHAIVGPFYDSDCRFCTLLALVEEDVS